MKVCYVLSYKYPNYVRTEFILRSLQTIDGVEITKAVNSNKSVWRYFQTTIRLIKTRFRDKPDIYILGFRGAEMFWLVRWITKGKPLVYDEFINLYLWIAEEHKKVRVNSFAAKLSILLIVLVLFTQGGGAITHIVQSKDSWYWQNQTLSSLTTL